MIRIYDQARIIEPRLRYHFSDHRLGIHLSEMGCDNEQKVLRRRGWTFPPLLVCRAEWEKKYPKWKWRDTKITAWRAEESDDPKPLETMTPQEKAEAAEEAAAKAQEHANKLAKEAEIAKTRAKFRTV